jgi:hypothetical protein
VARDYLGDCVAGNLAVSQQALGHVSITPLTQTLNRAGMPEAMHGYGRNGQAISSQIDNANG